MTGVATFSKPYIYRTATLDTSGVH